MQAIRVQTGIAPPKEPERAKLWQATEQFEAYFLMSLWRAMRKMVPQGGLFGKASETRFYTEMMDEAYADNMSRSNQFSLGRQLYRELERALPKSKATSDQKV